MKICHTVSDMESGGTPALYMLRILQVAEKDGNLVFTLNEQDLDCVTMEMISQR